ncbi:hypothetical protein RIEPE_A0012 (plasmid) [Candidatus Riesia pediculicola USDA]|uniref:Uncharacterized protein n=1 Tax=Riesia pediculicola (strain USDA) TaxID=515618 RepID=D4G930_RIEPU|nr:hypothetical protein RIEPE_A0012 [Candidatus Riesia pediculicola USDA]ARC53556.1 hypothetical protein AOE55_00050 [Candidatus Riesia pediculicola]ARC54507.1 hypothetical protein AOE56_00035 [Candidatus Riesia pediculicola]
MFFWSLFRLNKQFESFRTDQIFFEIFVSFFWKILINFSFEPKKKKIEIVRSKISKSEKFLKKITIRVLEIFERYLING